MFPPITGVTTNLRPDIVIWSIALKTDRLQQRHRYQHFRHPLTVV